MSPACKRCGSDRLFQFKPNDAAAEGAAESYPSVCRACGAIHHKGEVLELGGASVPIENSAREMAEAAHDAGRQALRDLEADPGTRISAYFARVYQNGYLDGFLRAYAFYRHEGKEGRLKRVRELWQRGHQKDPFGTSPLVTIVGMDPEVYAEIDQLLSIGDSDAASRANIHPTRY